MYCFNAQQCYIASEFGQFFLNFTFQENGFLIFLILERTILNSIFLNKKGPLICLFDILRPSLQGINCCPLGKQCDPVTLFHV